MEDRIVYCWLGTDGGWKLGIILTVIPMANSDVDEVLVQDIYSRDVEWKLRQAVTEYVVPAEYK